MKVQIKIIIPKYELQQYIKDYEEFNATPTIEMVKKHYIEDFRADHNEYIDWDNIEVEMEE